MSHCSEARNLVCKLNSDIAKLTPFPIETKQWQCLFYWAAQFWALEYLREMMI